jgi:omega-hydroxy-beta-dihydromenaquinone-9 sulfotransferase
MNGTSKKKEIYLAPAVSYSFKILFGLFKANSVPVSFYPRILAITLINLVNLPFRIYEQLITNPRIRKSSISKDPVFIIGHWRSGTTHLHNILCQDPRMAYVTTYQSVFPDTLFNKAGRFVFENFMTMFISERRKGDNVIMGSSNPQEEEFTLGAKTPVCYYYFWMFPKNILKYYDSYVRFLDIPDKDIRKWKEDYLMLIKKALINTKGDLFLSKNPTNTGRVKVLLELFPNAKFIHIHRNPVEVFLSTLHFYNEMGKPLKLQDISQEENENAVFEIYKKLMNDYFEQKELIPAGNLVEVSFDELENNPAVTIENIYRELKLENYNGAEDLFRKYFEKTKSYKKNKHSIKREHLKKIMHEWDFVMSRYNYSIPEDIRIIE